MGKKWERRRRGFVDGRPQGNSRGFAGMPYAAALRPGVLTSSFWKRKLQRAQRGHSQLHIHKKDMRLSTSLILFLGASLASAASWSFEDASVKVKDVTEK
jgi:hypothetical protein